jgi:hypothetical protein
MSGTVQIGEWRVTRDGKRTTFTGPSWCTRQKRKELRELADRMLSGRAAVPGRVRRETLARATEALANARKYKPIPVPASSGNGWKDSSNENPWGARPRGNQLLAKTWGGGNCLKGCIASLLNASIANVPDPESSYAAKDDWHDHYNKRLEKATGHRLDFLPASLCPPRDPNRLWIAGIHEYEGDSHPVVARGHYVIHDPSGLYQGSLPLDRIAAGMLVVPTRRVVPVLSPLGNGYRVVSA